MEENLRLETLRLCKLWLDLLDHAGEYAQLYYMDRALERGFGAQYYRACKTLEKTYKTVTGLNAAIKRYLDAFPAELLEILDAQQACGLPAFCEERYYLNRIMTGLTMADCNGKSRRTSYRQQINKILKAATKGSATALSLNQLEAGYQEKMRKAAIRKAEKVANNKSEEAA